MTPDKKLETIEETITIAAGEKQARFPNFSVEMETGTGKTYVYIRTALDLHRRNGPRSGRGQGSHNRYQPAARAVLTFTARPICWQAMSNRKGHPDPVAKELHVRPPDRKDGQEKEVDEAGWVGDK